ncbi:proteasome assembly chaperone 4 isoform X1 [Phalaenopsis equestris]|uniref:proteasome assembly chaperone 4 isoform X1 n=1 Tax=Phalaenopsis equestris TaxID=78828 RepID=UPI0009E615F1|nr:proteasome assembly chaperone 4 isoform X1 [Phalaenopsis equestris]
METNDLDAKLSELDACGEPQANGNSKASVGALTDDVQITCFTEDLHDATLHFQIIRFSKQIYAWIGCNSAKFGHLYAAAPTRSSNSVSITSLLKGNAQNTGSSMAHRLVLKTGLSVVLACNIPKDSPVLEAAAERKLFEKLRNLGCIRTGPSPP